MRWYALIKDSYALSSFHEEFLNGTEQNMPHTGSIMTSKRWSVHWNYYNQAGLTWRAVMGKMSTGFKCRCPSQGHSWVGS